MYCSISVCNSDVNRKFSLYIQFTAFHCSPVSLFLVTGLAAVLRRSEQGASPQRDLSGVLPHASRELCAGAARGAPDRLGGHRVAEAPEGSTGKMCHMMTSHGLNLRNIPDVLLRHMIMSHCLKNMERLLNQHGVFKVIMCLEKCLLSSHEVHHID